MRSKVTNTIRKLLNTAAKGSGATGPERKTARAMADKLMLANGLAEAQIPLDIAEARCLGDESYDFTFNVNAGGGFWYSISGMNGTLASGVWP